MQAADFLALAPFILLTAGGGVVLALGAGPRHVPRVVLTAATLFFLFASAIVAALWHGSSTVAGLVVFDAPARLFVILFALGTAGVALLAHDHPPIRNDVGDEFFGLLLFATLGMALLASAAHLLTAFLGLEILAVPLFALIAWRPALAVAVCAGITYTSLAGLSAAFLFFGAPLVLSLPGSRVPVAVS